MKLTKLAQSAAFALAVLTAVQITYAQADNTTTPAATAPAHHHHGGPKCHNKGDWEAKREEMKKKFAQDLNLTTEQQTKIDALHQAFYDAHKAEFDAQKAKFAELCKMKESGASEADIHAKMEAMPKANYEAMKADHEKLDSQIRAVLTPEQAKKFDAMKAERAKRYQDGKGGWGHHHDETTTTTPQTIAPAGK